MTARLLIGDALTVLRTMPAASIDCVITSPPYLALRSYLPADHPDKAAELGSEATPAAFIDALLDVTEELRRVLAPHGTLAVELGDTYSGSGGAGGDYNEGGLRDGQAKFRQIPQSRTMRPNGCDVHHTPAACTPLNGGSGWPHAKSLCQIPESYRWALAYGRNPFNGRTTPRWRVRNVVRHFRPNPPVGALGDKWRPATSDWAIACAGGSRYFDLDAVRATGTGPRSGGTRNYVGDKRAKVLDGGRLGDYTAEMAAAGAPPLDWYEADDLTWRHTAGIVLPTAPYPGAHYATFSPALVQRFIECMTPRRVCTVCGKPSERISTEPEYLDTLDGSVAPIDTAWSAGRTLTDAGWTPKRGHMARSTGTLGWTDCGHDSWRTGVVLDCFAGSGTTLAVATGHGYDAVGIELNPGNVGLIAERVGMFLEVA